MPTFFASEFEFRRWLEANHETASELLVGFWKKGSGKPSIDWPQARDQALCFGWIDGVRKSLGDEAYTIRFTPRREGSVWSKVNVERFEALKVAGQMTPAGEAAFEAGKDNRSNYAYEREVSALDAEQLAAFKAYPTLFIIDRKGVVRSVHTGYAGPATGAYHEAQNRELTALVDALLAEPASGGV